MATNTIGSLAEFKPESEKIEAYLERVQLFFDANGIKDDKKSRSTINSDWKYYLRAVKQSFSSREAR